MPNGQKWNPTVSGKSRTAGVAAQITGYFLKPFSGSHEQGVHGEICYPNSENGIPLLKDIETRSKK
ncbi:MAG: hypothetical protein A3F63_16550 [Pseudomonadales bacterium RIFCSPHIGHO2_12_FULL_40_16]|nr:MAG: hypothetical protein A2W44_03910 [Acinetobacter sp. RIFCSPHIGHO2_12_41_5]OHC24190.1 MAG: hypothetical protein A3F63_16550 [Pseudomonadales bacterium RIFCSPHIGHO2_12_FULL_40_16]